MVGILNLQIYFLLKIQFIKTQENKLLISSAEPLADPRGRQKRIPPPSNFFHFNAVFGKTANTIVSWDDKNWLKFSGKTNRLKISLQNAYFYYFM